MAFVFRHRPSIVRTSFTLPSQIQYLPSNNKPSDGAVDTNVWAPTSAMSSSTAILGKILSLDNVMVLVEHPHVDEYRENKRSV